jgi:hypothetical protein
VSWSWVWADKKREPVVKRRPWRLAKRHRPYYLAAYKWRFDMFSINDIWCR